jgi:hypothetical protein
MARVGARLRREQSLAAARRNRPANGSNRHPQRLLLPLCARVFRSQKASALDARLSP